MVTVKKLHNNLEQQSFLQFWYPKGNGQFTKVTLPFFENVRIEESGGANYVNYQPLSRPGSLFSYTGAKSRGFSLNFNITFPHIFDYALKKKFTTAPINPSPEEEKKKFFKTNNHDIEVPSFVATKGNALDFFKEYSNLDELIELEFAKYALAQTQAFQSGQAIALDPSNTKKAIDNLEKKFAIDAEKSVVTRQVIDIIVYWINIIRTSTLNNADSPSLGPPIIRLNHGIMYQDIPCVCFDYRISHDGDRAGYEQRTMLPRSINISMGLAEHRTGDFTKFDIFDMIKRDNVAGWEAVLGERHTLDPISRRFIGDNNTL